MGFKEEQKKAIRQRAEQLYGGPLEVDGKPAPDTGKYVLQATKELFTPEDLEQIFAPDVAPPPVAPDVAPPPVAPDVAPPPVAPDVQEERPTEIIKADLDLEAAEKQYEINRRQQLAELGLSQEEIDIQLKKEIESFREPVPLGFGDVAERREGGVLGPITAAAEAVGVGPRVTQTLPSAPVGINYRELANKWAAAQELSRDQAEKQVDIFRKQIVEPRIEKAKSSGLSSVEAEKKALEESFEFLKTISTKFEDKSSYLQPETTGSGDPWIRAFSKQVELGEGVPNLTDEEKSYLNAIEQSKISEGVAARKGETKQVIKLSSGSEVPYDPKNPPRRLPAGATIISRPKTEEELRAEVEKEANVPWWIDPELSKKVIAEPEKYEQTGIFSTITPYGTSKGTTASWLLSGAAAAFNAVAGLGARVAYDLPGQLQEARAEERKKKGFEDSPILLNIDENRGFMGEAQEAAELGSVKTFSEEDLPEWAQLSPKQKAYLKGRYPLAGAAYENMGDVLYYTTLAGGFAADILDPSLDIVRAVGVIGRSAARNYRGLGKVYEGLSRSQKASKSLSEAAKLGFNDFLDNALGADVFARNKRFEAGDVRGLVAKNLTEDFKAADAVAARGGDNASDVLDDLKPPQRSSVWGRKYADQVAKSDPGATADDVIAAMDRIYKGDDVAKRAVAVGEDLDNFAGGAASLSKIRRKDLARALGALASVDEAAKNAMKGSRGIKQMVQQLEKVPDSYNRLKTILFYDEAAKEAAKMSGEFGAPIENIVAITRNTWATKPKAKEILDRAKESPTGQLALELDDVELVVSSRGGVKNPSEKGSKAKRTDSRILPAYKLTDEQAKKIKEIALELQRYNKLDKQTAALIDELLKNKLITTENFRTLIDGNIDLIAEGIAGTGTSGVTRARDLSSLSIQEQMEYLVPLERRTIGREAYKVIMEKLTEEVATTGNLSVGQKQLLNKATQDISNLDSKLRKELEQIMKDPDVQKLYGIEGGVPTYEIGLGRLIIGPKPNVDKIEDTINGILNSMFFAKETKENAFDLLSGTSVMTNTGVFTDEAMDILRPVIEKAAKEAAENPDLFWSKVRSVLEEAGKIVSGVTKVPGKDLLRYDPKDITKVLDKTAGKIPSEVQVAAYYRKEAQRIAEESLSDLINTEIGKGRLDFREQLDDAVNAAIEAKLGTKPFGMDAQIKTVANRAKKQLQGKDRFEITAEDIAEIFELDDAVKLLQDPDFMEAIAPYFEIAEDVASGVIRRNKLNKTDVDVQKVEDIFKKLTDQDGEEYKQLEVLFGEDVASQLRSELIDSYSGIKKDLIDLLDKRYSDGTFVKSASNMLKNFKDKIENLRYLLILNTRPRFHGPNLLTGAEIVYSTTGRIVNPLDLVEAAKVLRNTNPTEVIFRDASGRGYTSAELNRLLDTTGRSVYTTTVPGAQQKAIVDLLESTPNTISDKIRGAKESFENLPQSEDLLFRYAILKKALQEGRSLDDALALSRASMFDLGDITKPEEYIRRLSLFYGFARNSLVNAINNLTSIKGLKRITKTKRARDNLSRFFTSDEDREYAPSYAESRVLLGKIGFDFEKGKDLLIASPPIQGLDAVYTLMDFLKGDISGLFGGALRPEYKAAFGVDDKFSRELSHVPIEHINILKLSTDHPEEAINFILAGFGAEPSFSYTDKNGNIVIPLDTAKQRAAYKKFMDYTSGLGINSPFTDWSRFISTKGTTIEDMGLGGRIAFMSGAATPLATFTPAKQAYYDRISRLAEINKATAAMRKSQTKQSQAEETPAETVQREGQAQKVKDQSQKLPTRLSQKPKEVRTKRAIAADLASLQNRAEKGEISKEYYREEKAKLKAEKDALK